MAERVVRVSARPPQKFSASDDFALWLKRFNLYLEEAEVPREKRAKELLSLLDDTAFRVVGQLGLLETDNYDALKQSLERQFSPEGNQLEWQYKLQSRRQKPGEMLTEFAGELRYLVDKAYPKWDPEHRLEVARNQFIQGIESPSVQLILMKEMPKTLDIAVELAQQQYCIEAAQKQLHHPVTVAPMRERIKADSEEENVNALQLKELSKQIAQLSDELARFKQQNSGSQVNTRSPQQRTYRGRTPVCWNCGKRGHIKRMCPSILQGRSGLKTPSSTYPTLNAVSRSATITVQGLFFNTPVRMLVDTGSAVTIVGESVWKRTNVRSNVEEAPSSPIVTANGNPLSLLGKSEAMLTLGDVVTRYPVLIAKDLTQECIIGADFLECFKCIVDISTETLTVSGRSLPLEITRTSSPSSCHVSCAETTTIPGRHQMEIPAKLSYGQHESLACTHTYMLMPKKEFMECQNLVVAHSIYSVQPQQTTITVNPSQEASIVHLNQKIGLLDPLTCVGEVCYLQQKPNQSTIEEVVKQMEVNCNLPPSERLVFRELVEEFSDIISLHNSDLGQTGLVKHTINTGDASPIKQPVRRLPFHQRQLVKSMLDDMSNRGIIEPSSSPWSAPIVLVKKKDGSQRFCVDYRRLNNITKKDAYPLPRIDDTLDALSGAKWFSTIDLTSGYWQVEVNQADQEKTAFCTPFGLFQFKVMPFGLTNAPSTFQSLMELVLRGLHWSTCLVYLDDIIVYSSTIDEHFTRLREVFGRLRRAGLKIKPSKCSLFRKNIKYLGYIISEAGIQTDYEKTDCIRNWPVPKNLTELKQFLGLATYYRKFVKDFSDVASPLHRLTQKNKPWEWTTECQQAFVCRTPPR